MKKQTKIIIAIALLFLGAYFAYNYMYQEHRDIKTEEAKLTVSAIELAKIFKDNQSSEVLNSTVQVSGIITEINANTLTIDNSVQCSFDLEIEKIKINKKITVKGRCIGYDDLFEIVKLDQSTIIN